MRENIKNKNIAILCVCLKLNEKNMPTTTYQLKSLRDLITNVYRMDETECLNQLIPLATVPQNNLDQIQHTALELVTHIREYQKKQKKINTLLQQYDLSTEEGIALMCLAEALLRIPDKT